MALVFLGCVARECRDFHRPESIQLQAQQETVVLLNFSFQRKLQLRNFLAHFPPGQLGHLVRSGFAF
jgi:hypothetical protein